MNDKEMAAIIERLKKTGGDREVVPEGVVFVSERSARIATGQHDKVVEAIGVGWLAKNRATSKGPLPTKEGDVVVRHLNQLFQVWVATKDGAQEPDQDVAPNDVWSRDEAEQVARKWAAETIGQIYWLQKNGEWSKLT